MPIQSQGIITRDNVSVDIAAVAYFRVIDARKAHGGALFLGDAIGRLPRGAGAGYLELSPWLVISARRVGPKGGIIGTIHP